jgi:CrcB protein
MALVLLGGFFGAMARDAVAQAWPAKAGTLPPATLAVNLSGAFLLGLLLEALVRSGEDAGHRRSLRLLLGTGFLGAYTTYSTFAVEVDLQLRAGRPLTALSYVALTIGLGLLLCALGIAAGGALGRGRGGRLPIDPDTEPEAPQ